jgi:MAF protein
MGETRPVEFLLASQSPRRRELIQLLGYPVRPLAAHVDEDSITVLDPAVNVVETAVLKAHAIAQSFVPTADVRTILIAADTTVAVDGVMLNKPVDAADARRMLRLLHGRDHEVHTGYVVRDMQSGAQVVGVHTAVVTMRPYTDTEIADYVATSDPLDKAGAYAIQHPVFRPVSNLQGCYLGVMGLPLCNLVGALGQVGVDTAVGLTTLKQAHQQFPCPVFAQLFLSQSTQSGVQFR